ncbi:hypothetical protein NM688_g8304 [Phlebia brevispora]|uniref:Uncharacterized protein n=1 Tax=Phlebia brevispora TaxID=194682 RepID=A0ACC1RSW9_9APHY|nr:hypothetical protein NM688_g8304 [Phlebia brevispora]
MSLLISTTSVWGSGRAGIHHDKGAQRSSESKVLAGRDTVALMCAQQPPEHINAMSETSEPSAHRTSSLVLELHRSYSLIPRRIMHFSTLQALIALGSFVTLGVRSMPTVKRDTGTKNVFAHFMVGFTYSYTSDDWMEDVTEAHAAGIDGFALNIGSDDWQPSQVAAAYAAAESSGTGFKLFISYDMRYVNAQRRLCAFTTHMDSSCV